MKLPMGDQEIANSILHLRGDRVLLDFHLAQMYEVETRALKQQVRRNSGRFPEDFMFQLNQSEIEQLVSQNVIPDKRTLGGSIPMAFTEQGVAMLSSVLRSRKAIEVNIAIMRTFVHVRRMIQDNRELERKLNFLEKKYDEKFQSVFNAIKKLVEKKNTPRSPIGYKSNEKP